MRDDAAVLVEDARQRVRPVALGGDPLVPVVERRGRRLRGDRPRSTGSRAAVGRSGRGCTSRSIASSGRSGADVGGEPRRPRAAGASATATECCVAVPRDVGSVQTSAAADAAAAEPRASVLSSSPHRPAVGQAEAVALARHRREVGDAGDGRRRRRRIEAQEREHAVLGSRRRRSTGSRRASKSRAYSAGSAASTAVERRARASRTPRVRPGQSSRCQSRLRSSVHSRFCASSPPMNSSCLPGCAHIQP